MADLGGDREGDKSNWSVSKLILFLKTAFLAADFAQVDTILDAREQKLKQEIGRLKQVEASLLYKFEEESLDKMNVQAQLKKCQAELKEVENKNSKLQGENALLLTRAKGAEERCEKLVAEVKELGQKVKKSVEKENEMLNLRLRNHELECEKARLEDELAMVMKRYEELDKRVLTLESDLPLLMNEDDPKSVNRTQNGDSATMGVKKCDVIVKQDDVSFGPSRDSLVKTNGNCQNTRSARLPSQNIIEIGDSDDESAPVNILIEKGTTLLHPADNGSSDQIGAEKGSSTLKRKRTSSFGGESENGDTLSKKFKMRIFEEPVCKPDNGPLSRCSTTTISSSDEVKKGFTAPKEDFMASRQREQQTESEQKSPNLLKGFPGLAFLEENSSSSESDSDDDNDGMNISFNHSQLAPEVRKENRN